MSGTVTTNGEDANGQSYVLQIKPEGGRAVTYFIDKKTFLPSKMETLKEGITSTTYFDDWRQVGAIKVPFRARQTESDPRNNAVIKIQDVRLNTIIEAKTFEKPESTVRDFRFEKCTNSAQIAFDQIGKTIYLSARINNSRPMWFLLDTGAGASLIDARRARTLGLKSEGKAATSGRGGYSEISFTKGVSFTLPGVRLLNQSVVSIPFNNIAGHVRRNFGGILGYDFISRFVVEIDYVNQTITLYDPQGYNYKGSGHRVPITVDGTPFVKAEVQVNGREPVQGRFMIDTGFDGATTLYGPFIKAHKLLQSNGKTIGITRSGVAQSKGVKSRIERFTFGGFSFRNVITNFLLGEKGTEADTDIAGLIGNEVFRGFKVILDYSRQEMILEPNDQFSETLDENLSGIEFELRAARRSIFKVNDVAEESPADKAGIWPGDVLVAIDNQSATSFSMKEINSLFRQEGREYLLTFKRGGKVFKAQIKNIRLI
jgi:predicted aspartyl protease